MGDSRLEPEMAGPQSSLPPTTRVTVEFVAGNRGQGGDKLTRVGEASRLSLGESAAGGHEESPE